MKWSPRHTLAAGAGLILAVNAIALAGVAYNRSGEPDSVLRLTERDLRRQYDGWGFARENSGLALKLQWRVRTQDAERTEDFNPFIAYRGEPVWLTAAKLAELGVDTSEPVDTERGKRRYARLTSRESLLVLELDGENHRWALGLARARSARAAAAAAANPGNARLKSRAESAAEHLEDEEKAESRLFIVDAGRDAPPLRAKYPDRARYAIVRGRIQPVIAGQGAQARLGGYIEALAIDHVNVPVELRPVFERASTEYEREAPRGRFEAVVNFGRRLEPWLAAARKI
jgi:hypothetical protein